MLNQVPQTILAKVNLFHFRCILLEIHYSRDKLNLSSCKESEAPASKLELLSNIFSDRMHAHFILNNKTCFKMKHELIVINQ